MKTNHVLPPYSFLAALAIIFSSFLLLDTSFCATFVPGDVFWADGGGTAPFELMNATGGGNFASASPFASIGRSVGQIAWSADLTIAYITEFANNRVVAITAAGVVTVFATGISNPSGLLRTNNNHLLVVSYGIPGVIDITAGGNFSGATPFANGFSGPRSLLQLANGKILLSDQNLGKVIDITAGGNFSGNTGFAFGFPQTIADLVQNAAGHIYVADYNANAVFDITSGGNFLSATAFASGKHFVGLTINGSGRLLASELLTGSIYDITSGGNFSSATPFASNLPGSGDTALDTVPSVPEPTSIALLLVCNVCLLARWRLRRNDGNV